MASGMTPTPSGWASAWFARRRSRAPRRCTSIGTAVSSAWSKTVGYLAALLASLITANAADLRLFEAVEPYMGTLFRIKLYTAGEAQAAAAFRAAFDRVRDL